MTARGHMRQTLLINPLSLFSLIYTNFLYSLETILC